MDKDALEALLADSPSWLDPANEEAKTAFIRAMKNYQYGYNPTMQAWAFFLIGWNGKG